jgi:hypothetical protein
MPASKQVGVDISKKLGLLRNPKCELGSFADFQRFPASAARRLTSSSSRKEHHFIVR